MQPRLSILVSERRPDGVWNPSGTKTVVMGKHTTRALNSGQDCRECQGDAAAARVDLEEESRVAEPSASALAWHGEQATDGRVADRVVPAGGRARAARLRGVPRHQHGYRYWRLSRDHLDRRLSGANRRVHDRGAHGHEQSPSAVGSSPRRCPSSRTGAFRSHRGRRSRSSRSSAPTRCGCTRESNAGIICSTTEFQRPGPCSRSRSRS